MPIPFEYQNASRQFDRFMVESRDNAGLATTNMAWNMVVGVFHAFRARLSLEQALIFADALPPVVRALFLENWDPTLPSKEFDTFEAMLDDVRSVRRRHNFSTANAIPAVATALRNNIDIVTFLRALEQLPPAAQNYWLSECNAGQR
ncbi:DUF2267 domain-containing protein [Duganella sp. FT94W]|uniref:DUF2267 domain-containing protein n=1 Tax=Duganella lactea TaxID=2692173 RepID=A0ABW9VCR7_9BURK|nr:DUF2267 domain-containing protein [Duganella lactea]MYM36459.1 DUF2267 domain-containing protein [Duganella lactea]